MRLLGLDHADIRVPSLVAVEPFFDRLLPMLGLPHKSESHVGEDGEWRDVDGTHARTAISYHLETQADSLGWFVGFIEEATSTPHATRIAFALEHERDLAELETLVRTAGGRMIERSIEEDYPAVFFEDPVGTRLEVCARRRAST